MSDLGLCLYLPFLPLPCFRRDRLQSPIFGHHSNRLPLKRAFCAAGGRRAEAWLPKGGGRERTLRSARVLPRRCAPGPGPRGTQPTPLTLL